jgi:hypothetical protein
MARTAAKKERDPVVTLAVSPYFARVITGLAKARGLTVRAFCDQYAEPKFAGDWKAHLASEVKQAEQRGKPAKAGA